MRASRAAIASAKSVAVERSYFSRAKIGERQHDDGVLLCAVARRLAKALGKHGEKSGGALFGFGLGCGQVRRGLTGNGAGFDLQRLHDGLESFAHFGGRGVAGGRRLFKTGGDDAFQFRRDVRNDLTEVDGIRKLDGADGLKVLGIGARKRMTAAGKFVQDHAERPYIRLHAGLAGNKLLGRHVANSAAARGVSRGNRGVFRERRL